jgi:iron complex outermembrane receptor protein
MFRPVESLRVYASVGDGFETPTFNEMSYRADGQPGLAFFLRPATSNEYEAGAKWHPEGGLQVDAALFRAETTDDLAVARNSGGRSSFQNIPGSRRQGFEAAIRMPIGGDWQVEANYTLLDSKFTEPFRICGSPPCTTPNIQIAAGTRIPGVADHQGHLQLTWSRGPWNTALELNASSNVTVNDRGTERAPGYGVWSAELGRNWELSESTLRGFARIDNLLDKSYVGSVIVNEGNSRYFEAATDRTAMVGLQWRWH